MFLHLIHLISYIFSVSKEMIIYIVFSNDILDNFH